jgi:hypothetical protein
VVVQEIEGDMIIVPLVAGISDANGFIIRGLAIKHYSATSHISPAPYQQKNSFFYSQ